VTASSLALVATVRGLDGSFLTWLYHHYQHGFRRIYLVFDAPDEDRETIDAIRSSAELAGAVLCIENDARHQERVRSLPQYGILEAGYERTVVHRQMLNVGAVMHHAIEEGIGWLLHLDSDELLAPYSPGVPIARYFEQVPERTDEVIFPNFEALPESEQIGDPFLETTLFKKSPYYMRYREFELLYTAWNGHSGTFKLFNAYITGKSALRMRDANVPFVPASVHHFLPIRFNKNVHIEDAGGPIVLHDPHCGLNRFVQRFTGFNRDRVNTYDGRGFTEDLYRQAAELVLEGREHELPSLYRRLVMLDDPRLRTRLHDQGFLLRRSPPHEGAQGRLLPAPSFEKDPAPAAPSHRTTRSA